MTTTLRTIAIDDPALDFEATKLLPHPETGDLLWWFRDSREADKAVIVPGERPSIFVISPIGIQAWRSYVATASTAQEAIWRAFEVGVEQIERPDGTIHKPSNRDPFRRWTQEELDKAELTPAEAEDIGTLAWTRGHMGKARRVRWQLSPSWASVSTSRMGSSRPAVETESAPQLDSETP